MVERLSNLAYLSNAVAFNQPHGGGAGSRYCPPQAFNPTSVSFDINTPEELAAVNEFLITLGRDVTTTARAQTLPSRHSARDFDDHPGHSYFNTAGLSELGLTGMPGIMNSTAGSGASFSDAAMYSTSSAGGFTPYPSRSVNHLVSVPGVNFAAPQPTSLLHDMAIPFFSEMTAGRDGNSFASAVSTPPPASDSKLESPPPFHNRVVGYRSPETQSPHSAMSTPPTGVDFDFVRTSRGPPPVAHITPLGYHPRTTRPVLKTLPSGRENRMEPSPLKPLKPAPSRGNSPGSNSLYHLLTSGSQECTLAPLNLRERSSSPSTSSSCSGSSTPEPHHHGTVLPSLKAVTSGISTERLASSVRDFEIESQTDEEEEIESTSVEDAIDVEEEQQRQEHARLIKDILIFINSEYKKRYGVPGVKNKDRLVGSRTLIGPGVPGIQRPLSSMDVEMTVV